MTEKFRALKRWVEEYPVEAAMRIDELEAKNESLKKQLAAKIALVNNGWEEERYALQEENEQRKEIMREHGIVLRKDYEKQCEEGSW